MSTPVAPTPAALIAGEFLSYLQTHQGLPVAGYLQPPEVVPAKREQSPFNGEVAPTALPLNRDCFAVELDLPTSRLEGDDHGSRRVHPLLGDERRRIRRGSSFG